MSISNIQKQTQTTTTNRSLSPSPLTKSNSLSAQSKDNSHLQSLMSNSSPQKEILSSPKYTNSSLYYGQIPGNLVGGNNTNYQNSSAEKSNYFQNPFPITHNPNMSQQSQGMNVNLNQAHNTSFNQNSTTGVNSTQNSLRFQMIESNLSRLCNQHDALMPLLSLLESMPLITKVDQMSQNFQQRLTELESQVNSIDGQNSVTTNQHVFASIERNFKSTQSQIGTVKGEMKDIHTNIQTIHRANEAKLKEELNTTLRGVDSKLDQHQKDVQQLLAEFKNSILITLQKTDNNDDVQNYHTFSNDKSQKMGNVSPNKLNNVTNVYYNNENHNESLLADQSTRRVSFGDGDTVKNRVATLHGKQEKKSEFTKASVETDINNIYREIGMIRCEIEQLHDRERREYILSQRSKKQFNGGSGNNLLDDKLKMAELQTDLFQTELMRFDQENSARLNHEIESIREKFKEIENLYMNVSREGTMGLDRQMLAEIQKEIQFVEDRFFNLKTQMHGTQKKCWVDIRQIQDSISKMTSLTQDRERSGDVQAITGYKDQLNKIDQSVTENVQAILEKQKNLEQVIQSFKTAIYQ